MSPSRWAPIEKMIREFQGLLAPTAPQLKVEKGVDYAESYPAREAASPPLNKWGVYLIFDNSESKIYIGVTIERPLADRCQEHVKNKQNKRFKRIGFTPRWIDVIPFDRKWALFAPSLELYLIDKVARKEQGCMLALVNVRGRLAAFMDEIDTILAEE